ncbi:phosphatidylserine decarboxylase [uncultured Bacteroides sp.]|uniref:phosphatidylserine decarboxylase n=1 Tax=uncultured Bacteroides sp. TaxID=162156 RepID=UPI002610A26D|nr:phosphatidylserine decarboxylase [uncultured Bacteroides sp.]
MKNFSISYCRIWLLASVLLLTISCKNDPTTQKNAYSETTQKLIDLVENDSQLKSLLTEAIEKGKKINPDPKTNPVQSLEAYYDFIDYSQTAMPWDVIVCPGQPSIFGRMYQALCYCYFINCMPLESLEGKNFFTSSVQYVEPYRSWLVDYCKSWGNYLSSADSWNKEYEDLMMKQEELGMTKGWYEDPSNWHSFNDFFSRRLKSPDQRPIVSPEDNSVVASPCDSEPQGVWAIDDESYIVSEDKIAVKSRVFNSVRNLISPESPYCDAFAGGTFYHAFLNVNDYHRYHFPLSGTIKEIRVIPGDDALGGTVTWEPQLQQYVVDCSVPGWQSIETRGLVILDTEEYGLVAVMPIGMSQVASVNFEPELKVGSQVKKGDMLGYFLFGGSDFVLVFQKQAGFHFTAPANEDGSWKHILMGEEIGLLKKQ